MIALLLRIGLLLTILVNPAICDIVNCTEYAITITSSTKHTYCERFVPVIQECQLCKECETCAVWDPFVPVVWEPSQPVCKECTSPVVCEHCKKSFHWMIVSLALLLVSNMAWLWLWQSRRSIGTTPFPRRKLTPFPEPEPFPELAHVPNQEPAPEPEPFPELAHVPYQEAAPQQNTRHEVVCSKRFKDSYRLQKCGVTRQ